MGTYDYAIGDTTPKWDDHGGSIRIQQIMNAAAIIASNATLTAAAKITSGDIINAINLPAGFVVTSIGVKVTTAATAGTTLSMGLAAGTEAFAALDIATTGYTVIAETVDWGYDNDSYVYTADGTLDVAYLADETIGEFTITVIGYQL